MKRSEAHPGTGRRTARSAARAARLARRQITAACVAPLDGLHLDGIRSGETRLVHLELGLAHRGVAQPLANADVRRLVFFPVREAVAASQLAELLLECVELHARPDVGGSVAAHLLTVAGLSLGARAGARAARQEARAAL